VRALQQAAWAQTLAAGTGTAEAEMVQALKPRTIAQETKPASITQPTRELNLPQEAVVLVPVVECAALVV
jgi:hypothetical protein